MTLYVLFSSLNVPNQIFLCGAVGISFFFSVGFIRLFYYVANLRSTDPRRSDVLIADYGWTLLKVLSILHLIVALGLTLRVAVPFGDGENVLGLTAISKSAWALARMGVVLFVVATIYIFDAHPGPRIFVVAMLPLMAICDMASEITFAVEAFCIEHQSCVSTYNELLLIYFFAWRDLGSVTIEMAMFMIAIWLSVFYGFCSNTMYIPMKEHRDLTKFLTQQIDLLKPKKAEWELRMEEIKKHTKAI